MTEKERHLNAIRSASDAYHADYMEFHLKEWPRFHEHFASSGIMLDDYVVNAGLSAGFRLLRMSEHSHHHSPPLSKLPSHVLLLMGKNSCPSSRADI